MPSDSWPTCVMELSEELEEVTALVSVLWKPGWIWLPEPLVCVRSGAAETGPAAEAKGDGATFVLVVSFVFVVVVSGLGAEE